MKRYCKKAALAPALKLPKSIYHTVQVTLGWPRLNKVQKNLGLWSFMSMVYLSGKINSVLSQAENPLCSTKNK